MSNSTTRAAIPDQGQSAENNKTSSEIYYQGIFEAAEEGILILDIETKRIIDVNPFLCELLGYSREDLLGKELWEIGLFEDRAQSQAAFREMIEKGRIRYEDLSLRSKDGERLAVEFISKVYRDGGRRVVLCVIRDITARKLIQKDKYFLAAVVESLEDSVVTIDFNAIITSWNKGAERLYGYRAEEAIGLPLTVLTLPEDMQDLLAKVEHVRRGETVLTYETERIRKGGQPLFLSITLSPVKDDFGRVIGVSTIARNITERKQAEEAVAAHVEDLQLLSGLGERLISEGDPQVLYQEILAAAVTLTRADAGAVQILDENTSELVLLATQGFDRNMRERFHRVDASPGTPCGDSLAAGKRSFVDFDAACVADPDGSLRMYVKAGYLSGQSSPLITSSGKTIGMLSTHWRSHHRLTERQLHFLDLLTRQAADLIERKMIDEVLREVLEREQAARAEGERANRLKDEFLATLSHEMRNPLNTIIGYAEVLLRAPDAKHIPAILGAAEAIRRNAETQAQLISDLLDLSRLHTGKLSIERRPISLAPVVGDAVASIRAQAEGKGLKLDSDYPSEPLTVSADPVRVQQIVWNLVNNAVKFTPRDGRVSVRLSREADKAKLEVEDTGQGIDPEFLPHVFDMFRQADAQTTRTHGGLGIGLALVKQLVDLHGGQVQAHSEGAGRGSRFTVWFPLRTTAPERPAALTKSIEGELTGARILVVDDNPDSLDMLRILLEGEGAVVETASSGPDALRMTETSQMDLVISDISMPGMDGYEFLKELRGRPRYANVSAIALTGFGREEDVERARQAGFTTHLTKPVDFEHLVRLARVALR